MRTQFVVSIAGNAPSDSMNREEAAEFICQQIDSGVPTADIRLFIQTAFQYQTRTSVAITARSDVAGVTRRY